jgi:anti-sigma regulatory factor (Ser/Thr protein kinase)
MGSTSDRLVMSATAESVGAARMFLEDALRRAGFEGEGSFEALLVISELTSNAIVHGSRQKDPDEQIEVSYRLDGGDLTICVRDSARGHAAPVTLTADTGRVSGRGLQIVDRLAEWSEQIVDGRREVRARLDLRPPRLSPHGSGRSTVSH